MFGAPWCIKKVECRNSGFYTRLLGGPRPTFGVHWGPLIVDVGNCFAHVVFWVLRCGPLGGPSAARLGVASELSEDNSPWRAGGATPGALIAVF